MWPVLPERQVVDSKTSHRPFAGPIFRSHLPSTEPAPVSLLRKILRGRPVLRSNFSRKSAASTQNARGTDLPGKSTILRMFSMQVSLTESDAW